MIKSPSKFTSLARLEQIKADNYVSETGIEYCAEEVDALIIEKKQAKALEQVESVKREERVMACVLESFDFAALAINAIKKVKELAGIIEKPSTLVELMPVTYHMTEISLAWTRVAMLSVNYVF